MASKYFKQSDLAHIARMQDRLLNPNPSPGVSDAVIDEVAQALLGMVADSRPAAPALKVRDKPPAATARLAPAAVAARTAEPVIGPGGDVEYPDRPIIFTVAGHLEDIEVGPAYATARALELQGVVQVQPIGYDVWRIPFNNDSGISELINQIYVRVFPFPGRPFGVCANSQGGIVWSRAYEEQLLPDNGALHQFQPQLRRVVVYGNPCRQKGVVRPGMPSAPGPNTRGIADNRIDATPGFWWEEVHEGDMFAAIEDDEAAEWATAIYEIVQLNWFFGMNSIVAQIFELFGNPALEIWAITVAITRAIMFGQNPGPHGGFDIRAAIEHMRGVTE